VDPHFPCLIAFLAQVAALAACESSVRKAAFIEPASGRRYSVFTRHRGDPGPPSPVLFAFHAYATDPEVLVRAYALERRAVARRGWILVVPEGTRDADGQLSWNASAACCGTGLDRPDDVGFLHRVLEELRRHSAVDPGRVYAIGESNGAFMAHRWACAAAGDLRAIVSISGAAPGPDDSPCAPTMPVSVLQIHGDQDQLIRFEGGRFGRGRYPSARESVETWRRLDLCEPTPRTARRWRLLLGASRVESWSCPRALVALWTVEGGAHYIPRLRFSAEEMLDFLTAAPVSPATK
jgi:polyhydroxybutyrate depolymerase